MIWKTQPRSDHRGTPGALSYIREGSGAPLVLIHGVGLRAESWAAMVPALAERFTVYAVDMPGHGGSPLDGAEHLEDYAARIGAFIDALEGPVRIAGHSMGAALALRLASDMPGNVCAVAALNAVYRRSDTAKEAVRARASALRGVADPTATLARWFGSNPEGALKDAALACGDWLKGADPEGYANAYRVFASYDGLSDQRLAALNIPVLFMTGAHDLNSTPAMSQAMAAMAPRGMARVSDGAAHMMPMTHADDVNAALLEIFENAGDALPAVEG